MSNSKIRKNNNRFKPYEGRKANDMHIRLTCDMMSDINCFELSGEAFKLYCYMKLSSKGNQEFEYPYTYAVPKLFKSKTTFVRHRQELIDKGFIEYINKTSAKNKRENALYRFIYDWYSE